MERGRKPLEVRIAESDRARLEEWCRRPKTAQALALRARIVLRTAEGGTSVSIAREFGGWAKPSVATAPRSSVGFST